MRKRIMGLTALAVLLLAAPVMATEAICGITWGSGGKSAEPMVTSPIVGVRAGQHQCYDRLVVDLAGPAPGYRVEYVPQVTQEGSGNEVPLRGGAKLRIVVLAPGYDVATGTPTFPATASELVDVRDYQTFRQVTGAGSFEGQTTIGLGVRARLPFRVFTLDGPGVSSRLVIDVAHRWS
ncbi:MAG: AMIN-like domain-containing (lipo)protein [Egibacteraceae bacterium]